MLVERKGTMPNSAPKPDNGGNNPAPKRNNFNPNNDHRKGHLNHVTREEAQAGQESKCSQLKSFFAFLRWE